MLDFKEIYNLEHLQNHLTYSQIRAKYNIPRGTWDYYVRKKLGLKNDGRKHHANDAFFDNIDSEEKAYLLGFLYADGYLASDGRIGCRLKIDDIEIIELLKKYIAIESPIEYSNNQNFKRKPQVSIRWKSKRLYDRMLELGFCVDKTHTNSHIFNNIPEDFKFDFMRGFCDGDGNVRAEYSKRIKSPYYRTTISFSNGTPTIFEDFLVFLSKYNCSGKIHNYKTYFTLSFDKAFDSYFLASKMYKNANIYLKRKYDKAIKIINYRTNTELTGRVKRFPEV